MQQVMLMTRCSDSSRLRHRDSFEDRIDHVLARLARGFGFVRQMHAVGQAGRGDGLDIFRRHEIVAAQPGPGPRGGIQGNRGSGTGADAGSTWQARRRSVPVRGWR